jgi:hypothetical protein
MYNFDLQIDKYGDDSPPNRQRYEHQRRQSIDERTREILERSRQSSAMSLSQKKEEPVVDFAGAYADLLKDIPKMQDHPISSRNTKFDSPLSSPAGGDSFDISAGDLEVGTFAAKRMKERAAERGRRMSFDQETYSSTSRKDKLKTSFSPDIKVHECFVLFLLVIRCIL